MIRRSCVAIWPEASRGRAVNDLRAACRDVVLGLQKLCVSRRLPKEERDEIVAIVGALRRAMRRDYEKQRFKAAIERIRREKPPTYPVA